MTTGLMNSSVTPASYDCLDGGACRLRRRRRSAWRVDRQHGVVGQLGPLPPLVAIHRVVAARRPWRCGRRRRVRITSSSSADVPDAAGRRRVAPVGDRVDEDARHFAPRGHLDERVQVALVAVDAAVGDEADEVERVRPARGAIHRRGSAGLSNNSPSRMLLSMRVRSW